MAVPKTQIIANICDYEFVVYNKNITLCIGHFSVEILGNVLFFCFFCLKTSIIMVIIILSISI